MKLQRKSRYNGDLTKVHSFHFEQCCYNKTQVPFTEAVRVQLYKMASSPNAVHTGIEESSLLCWKTSRLPSVKNHQDNKHENQAQLHSVRGKQINTFLALLLPGTQEWEQGYNQYFETQLQTSRDFIFFNILLIYKSAVERKES